MKILGCDLHAKQQSIAMVDTETGEFTEKTLSHEGNELREFYAALEGPCMKLLGVSGVFDYAGLNRSSRYRAGSCCLPRISRASASGLHLFGAEYPPRLAPVYASLCTSRYPVQDSRPSGSLLLSRSRVRQWRGPGFV